MDIDADAFEFRLVDERSATDALFESFAGKLKRLRSQIARGTVQGRDKIGARLKKIAEKHKLTAHVVFGLRDNGFDFDLSDKEAALQAALAGFCKALEQVRVLVRQVRFGGKDKIGIRVGKVVNKYKVAKHFVLDIRDDGFEFSLDAQKVASETALDGIYVIRTSVAEERLSADDAVRSYKSLSQVERAFRSIKTVDLKVRPIHHHLESRVRAHIFLCMLAYYVEWHMREAWRPLLFCDEEFEAKTSRDPVAPAQRSESALRKVQSKTLDDGTQVHGFQSLIQWLSGIVLNLVCAPGTGDDAATFEIVTTPNATQQHAFDLLKNIQV